ncbi:origin recognition complex subunit 6 isoform X2 [Rhinatrema bivittatum]|uniref:origin recognition complex subunit 6 isoform X2 n=1 Tax=Rhinatrema bivittatum TaxID=194408 RepID=UPI00112E3D59|nr:origin recognition complex subunit 6 isoform X2 [Rhinatrema bivittatum]
MELASVHRLAPRLGITSPSVLRKAEEYLRLSQLKCTGLSAHITATSTAVMCLDLASTSLKRPIDKDYLIKLSGLNKKTYLSCLKSFECLLGIDSHLGIRDLAVQFCCTEAVNTASKILQSYESSLPEAQRAGLDLSKPLFTAAALYTACRCLKVKVEKNKLVAVSGGKRAIFDRLCIQLEKLGQKICESLPQPERRPKTLLDCLEQEEGGEGVKHCKRERPQTEMPVRQDYQEWKRRILEKAAKPNAD